ncbi:MAG: hypothetical protein DRP06_00765 [Candidatus Aenigmatarchaeota archaeon]|nr:MAG: hypothetical protein DRP06_00765 [Candidatus Aenigmarchaeota archaeon]
MLEQEYYLGVDAGATKTTMLIVNSKGKKIFEAKKDNLSHRHLTEKQFVNALDEIASSIRFNLRFSCFAFAGLDTEEEKKKITKMIKKSKLGKIIESNLVVVNDIETVLPSIDAENGAAAIAGTGSAFFAVNKNNIVKAGGVGYLLADEGSGYFIGLKVLKAAVKSNDGRGKKTILERMAFNKLKIKSVEELVDYIYTGNLKKQVAGFAPLTEKALEKKDKVAREILSSAVDELEVGIKAVVKRAGLKGNFKIALTGSVFTNKFIMNNLNPRLKKLFPKAEICMVKNSVIGAAKLAMKRSK